MEAQNLLDSLIDATGLRALQNMVYELQARVELLETELEASKKLSLQHETEIENLQTDISALQTSNLEVLTKQQAPTKKKGFFSRHHPSH